MATATTAARAGGAAPPMTKEERKVIFASSLGTVFEWYDFYLYGSLAAIIAAQFFSGLDPTSAYIFALLAFAAGGPLLIVLLKDKELADILAGGFGLGVGINSVGFLSVGAGATVFPNRCRLTARRRPSTANTFPAVFR